MGRISRVAVIFALCAVMPTVAAMSDDDCEDAGKLGMMLGQIDRQCSGYRLTIAGRQVMINMAAKVVPLGGEACAAKGEVAMLEQMGLLYPKVGIAAASGDTVAFNRTLCDAIANYLTMLGDPALAEKSN